MFVHLELHVLTAYQGVLQQQLQQLLLLQQTSGPKASINFVGCVCPGSGIWVERWGGVSTTKLQ
jgi:hypothetical protein